MELMENGWLMCRGRERFQIAGGMPVTLMVENERSRLNTYVGLTGRLDRVFHPGTGLFLGTFFAAVFGRYQRQNDKGIYGEYDQQNQKG